MITLVTIGRDSRQRVKRFDNGEKLYDFVQQNRPDLVRPLVRSDGSTIQRKEFARRFSMDWPNDLR